LPPTYEKPSDRKEQFFAAKIIQQHLGPNYSVKETPTEDRQCNDLEIFHTERLVQIGEIKARGRTWCWFGEKGWVFEDQRINRLIIKSHRLNLKIDNIALFLKTKDNQVAGITYRKLLDNHSILKTAEPYMLTNDHGKKPAPDKTGFVIPRHLLTLIPL
jgi:hypothetical protein